MYTYALSVGLLMPLVSSCSRVNKLDIFSCEYLHAARSCDSSCVLQKDMKQSIVVNASEKSVMQIVFFEGRQTGAITYKDCIVFNERNWDCSSVTDFPHVYVSKHNMMANGTWSSYEEIRDKKTHELRNKDDKGMCAK